MDKQSWIGRLLGRKPVEEGKAQPSIPTTQTSVSPRTAHVTETASGGQFPEQVPSTPQILPSAATPSPTGDAEAHVPAVWRVGDVILDQYEVMGTLGEGGMGTVYKVHHRGWNTDLAVKSPKPEIFARTGGKENFEREAETWVNLGLHPHTVSCYYVRRLGNIPRIFAEYIEGGSLSDWIRTRRLYEGEHEQALERILDIAIQFAWGLHYAHEQGLVHQDVKPANVMMTADGIAKVTDFGLAKARAMAGEAGVPGEGQSILVSSRGMTPAYCSPEQADGRGLSRKTDNWSWGVSVLEMFVGGVTWKTGVGAREALASHEAEGPAIPLMPAEVVKLLNRCFQHLPEGRPATMLEVATELQAIYRQAVGRPYSRQMPKPAEALADNLNNRALSLFDLRKAEEAKQVWQQALEADPHHLEATYNRGVVNWHHGKLDHEVLVRQLETIQVTHGQRWQASYLLALVQLERGEVDAALLLLKEAAQQAPGEMEMQVLLGRIQADEFARSSSMHLFQGHTQEVNSVCLSADGRLALSAEGIYGSRDSSLRLWDVATGNCLRIFQGHTGIVTSVCLSADGRLALSAGESAYGSRDSSLRLWDVATGNCLRIFQGHTQETTAASLSADSRLALSGSRDKTVRLWEVATGRCLLILEGHESGVTSASLSADGCLALSSSGSTLRLWNVTTGRCLHTFEGHTEGVTSVSLSADGHMALSGSSTGAYDGSPRNTLRLWDVATGRCLHIFQGHTGYITSVSLSADSRLAISGSWDTTVRLWEVATGCCLRTFQGHVGVKTPTLSDIAKGRVVPSRSVTSVSLSADGRLALSGSADKTLRLWDSRYERVCSLRLSELWSHAEVSHVQTQAESLLKQAGRALGEAEFAMALALVREARALPGCERTPQSLEVWTMLSRFCRRVNLRTAWLARIFEGHTERVQSVSLSADGRLALSGSEDKTVRLWEVATGRCQRIFEGHTGIVSSVSLSADGGLALSGSYDKTVRLWEVATGRCLHIFEGHTRGVTSVSLSAFERLALSGSGDDTLRLWEVATGRCLRIYQGHHLLKAASLSADGRQVISENYNARLHMWEVATEHNLHTFEGHENWVTSVSLSADGSSALTGGLDRTVRLWEVATGRCLCTFQGHNEGVTSVSLSADGGFALSGSWDKTVRLWEATTGHCLSTFLDHIETVWSVSLSANGRLALSGGGDALLDGRGRQDYALRLWELDWELEAHVPADWDEGALPFLETFLILHTPFAARLPQDSEPSEQEIQQALTRRGRPSWTEQDFQALIRQLQYAGYGWLRPEGVRRKLEHMAQDWQGPPPLPGV